jgi:replicative DNA helicase
MTKKRDTPIYIGKDFWETGVEPPSSHELETILLGTVLVEYNVLHELGADFNVNLFHDPNHRIVAKAILDLFHRKVGVDIVTVTEELMAKKKVGKDGLSPAFVARLTDRIASSAHIEFHLRILQEMYLKRYITETCAKTMQKIHSGQADVFELHATLQDELESALNDIVKIEAESVSDLNKQANKAEMEAAEGGGMSGVPTGMKRVDKVTNGWQPSDLIIIAGRPSMGKTAFVISSVLEPAITLKEPIAIFSLEMSASQLVGRMRSQLSGLDVGRVIRKQLSVDEVRANEQASILLDDAPIYIDDTPAITSIELRSKARKLVKEKGVKLIIVDYLQLMRSGMNIQNRTQEIDQISRDLKTVAKELEVPVVALCQLSRSVETRGGDKKPMLSDLRESGQIEQDADLVAFCYRPEYYGIQEYDLDGVNYHGDGLFMLLIAKHRNGSLGEIPLSFKKSLARIQDHDDDCSEYSNTFVQRGLNESSSGGMTPNREFEKTEDLSTNNEQSKVFHTDGTKYDESSEDWMEEDEDDLPF